MVKCRTCGATYRPIQADGTRYFHVCAPLGVAELLELFNAGALELAVADRVRLTAASADDAARPRPKEDATRVQEVLAGLSIPRPDHRDENIAIPAIEKRPAVIVAVGKGEPEPVA